MEDKIHFYPTGEVSAKKDRFDVVVAKLFKNADCIIICFDGKKIALGKDIQDDIASRLGC